MSQKPIEIICSLCGIASMRRPSDIARAIKNSGSWRCKACTLTVRNKASAYPEGTRRKVLAGYVEIKVNGSWIREHRHIAEQHLGRKLLPCEIVHHRDGQKNNNDPGNLEVMTHAEHTVLHSTGRNVRLETREKMRTKAMNRHIPHKLTKESVLSIRSEYRPGKVSYGHLAEKYGVTPRTIACVVKRITWRHI